MLASQLATDACDLILEWLTKYIATVVQPYILKLGQWIFSYHRQSLKSANGTSIKWNYITYSSNAIDHPISIFCAKKRLAKPLQPHWINATCQQHSTTLRSPDCTTYGFRFPNCICEIVGLTCPYNTHIPLKSVLHLSSQRHIGCMRTSTRAFFVIILFYLYRLCQIYNLNRFTILYGIFFTILLLSIWLVLYMISRPMGTIIFQFNIPQPFSLPCLELHISRTEFDDWSNRRHATAIAN